MNATSTLNPPRPAVETPCDCSHKGIAFKRILVAVDGSPQSEYAVEAATRLAGQLGGAEIILVTAFWVDVLTGPEICYVEPEIRATRIEAAQALLDQVKAKMPAPLKVEKVLREGDAAAEIVAAAQLYGVDLIIMGTHGRGPVGQVFVGSVANAVTRKANCPVMTVAHPLPACKGA